MLIRRWQPNRRELFRAGATGAAALVLHGACGGSSSLGDAGGADGTIPGADGSPFDGPLLDATPSCVETEDNLLGPYWLDGAPERADLTARGLSGTRLHLTGRVFGLGGNACTPLAGALLDIWQSDDRGTATSAYSTTPDGLLRGRIYSEDDGSYDLRTIIPGHYLNGNQFRPAHIHVRVSAPGHTLLTTQLYFEGDPYNAIDPFIEAPLIMPLADASRGGKQAAFDFVIRTA